MKTALELIAEERQRQIDVKGYGHRHDDEHDSGQLAMAAAMYATPVMLYQKMKDSRSISFKQPDVICDWDLDVRRMDHNNTFSDSKRIGQLVKAGALIIAEIERLQRLAKQNERYDIESLLSEI